MFHTTLSMIESEGTGNDAAYALTTRKIKNSSIPCIFVSGIIIRMNYYIVSKI